MASYLYAVQDDQGREVVSAHVDVEKVGDVTAVLIESEASGDVGAALMFEDIEIDRGSSNGNVNLRLLRWPSDDKLSEPVEHSIS